MRTLLGSACWLILLAGCARPTAAPPALASDEVALRFDDEKAMAYVWRPTAPGPYPALILLHGDKGLTDGVKEQARQLAADGYVTMAVDLYRGKIVHDVLDAHIMERGLSEDQVQLVMRAAVNDLASRENVRADRIGILGWDMGGGHALDTALHDERIQAVVVLYGRVPTEPTTLKPLHASVLAIFAGQDEGLTPEIRERFQKAMQGAGKRLAGLHIYARSPHGFLDPEAKPTAEAVDAWTRIKQYLRQELHR